MTFPSGSREDLGVESDLRWIHDVHSNSVAIVTPRAEADELRFE